MQGFIKIRIRRILLGTNVFTPFGQFAAKVPPSFDIADIPDGATPTVPATWPELPILIDSPDIATNVTAETVEIRVPISELGSNTDFNYDGVTAGLRVSTSPHDPLLCVENVFDVASGDLSLPGTVEQ